jgi:phosphoglucosamine mutase
VAYLTRALRLDLGVVISASHNPFQDNGIKFFSAMGREAARRLGARRRSGADAGAPLGRLGRPGQGAPSRRRQRPLHRVLQEPLLARAVAAGLKIVVDAAHGAAYHVAPDVFHELGAEVVTIGCSPDGTNINDGVGATAPAALVAPWPSIKPTTASRWTATPTGCRLVDAGRLFNGDELLYVMVADRLASGQACPGVVGTLMTNMAVELALRRPRRALVRAKVGDRYVLEELNARGWQLGGEGSGHLLALDRHTTGDGIVSALQVCSRAAQWPVAGAAARGVTLFPQTLDQRAPARRQDWRANAALWKLRQTAVQRDLEGAGAGA